MQYENSASDPILDPHYPENKFPFNASPGELPGNKIYRNIALLHYDGNHQVGLIQKTPKPGGHPGQSV
jgi:hypothetical protein